MNCLLNNHTPGLKSKFNKVGISGSNTISTVSVDLVNIPVTGFDGFGKRYRRLSGLTGARTPDRHVTDRFKQYRTIGALPFSQRLLRPKNYKAAYRQLGFFIRLGNGPAQFDDIIADAVTQIPYPGRP